MANRMVALNCKNHPLLRWSCKVQAISISQDLKEAYYNGERNIFFFGAVKENGEREESYPAECSCSARDLRVLPEYIPEVIKFIEEETKAFMGVR